MKLKDPEKLKRARNIINLLLEGLNPLTYESIEGESFINDPKMIRIFSYISLVLNQDIIESLEEDEKEIPSVEIFTKRPTDNSNFDYKQINELKKLAEYMEKESSV